MTQPAKRWTWWVYPSDLEIRNNGERYKLTGPQVAPRLTLPPNWTLGNVIDAIIVVTGGRWNCQCHGETEQQCGCGAATHFVSGV